MRIRRKKNLDERVLRTGRVLQPVVGEKNFKIAAENKDYLDFYSLFGNYNPVELEIGCGKGDFISKLSIRRSDVNYIALEKVKNILVVAAEKIAMQGNKNVLFLLSRAELLKRFFPDGSVNAVYLNFSPPYPPAPYENRRLTNADFVSVYKEILMDGGKVEFKSDDKDFFDYSVNNFRSKGFLVEDVTEDKTRLVCGNIVTEYEAKFNALRAKVYAFTATK